MPLHRFFCPDLGGPTATLDADESRHATRVLRLAAGTEVELFDGAGRTARATIAGTSRSAVGVTLGAVTSHPAPPGPEVVLATALPRAHRQQFLFEKSAELGVAEICPIVCARSTVRPDAGSVSKWQRYCLEAAKQCGAVHLTRVAAPMRFAESLERCSAAARWIATPAADLAPTSNATPLAGAVAASLAAVVAAPLAAAVVPAAAGVSAARRVCVWIGPEGGFDADETRLASAAGLEPISLGRHILRIETAALAVAACLALQAEGAGSIRADRADSRDPA
ncbi:MAG TPA: RsmE family RNA methyltransferase [Phycisphaerae bacterium]|nr:RsmE family RNA methyltransferase [Phycisphaerae bacterium]